MTRIVLLAALALGAAGCAPSLDALAKDPAAVCATMTSVWFTLHIDRNGGCEMTARATP